MWSLLPSTRGAEDFKGAIRFTPEEAVAHQRHLQTVTKLASSFLNETWEEHLAFHRQHGVSKFYGDRNTSLDTRAEQIAALKRAGASPSLVEQLRPISCIGLTLQALERGFKEPGDEALWAAWLKIKAYVKQNDQDGSALVHALQMLGWKIAYWNPKPEFNEAWDRDDGNRRSKGSHAWRYHTVTKHQTYYLNKVDDATTYVGFGETVPEAFAQIPFFIGVAHGGYHVFPGVTGEVIEAHSTRQLSGVDNLERSPFNPLAPGGGPRWTPKEKYRSGILAVPPL